MHSTIEKIRIKASTLSQTQSLSVNRPYFNNTCQVGLVQWYRARLRDERSRFDAQSQHPEMTRGNIACKQQKSIGDDQSTLTLKHMGKVIQSPKQMIPVAPQNGPRSNKTLKKFLNTKLIYRTQFNVAALSGWRYTALLLLEYSNKSSYLGNTWRIFQVSTIAQRIWRKTFKVWNYHERMGGKEERAKGKVSGFSVQKSGSQGNWAPSVSCLITPSRNLAHVGNFSWTRNKIKHI